MDTVDAQLQLISRGAERIWEVSDLEAKLRRAQESGEQLIVKLGVDPTAPDIHLGHTVPLRKLRHFQQLGHQAVFLIGDFTGRIGDPSGRDKTRPPLTEEQILLNAKTYLDQVGRILDTTTLRVVYNSDWLNNLTFGELVRMAASTTMARMLEHNTFRQRLESSDSIRMHELLYPFMQGYDSVALKADVELGGSDQTYNLSFGRDLQRFYNQEAQVCLTMPILTGTDGVQKMSKSLGNYIGISEAPAIMFDKIMRMADSNIINYFTLLTDVDIDEVSLMEQKLADKPETQYLIDCKKRLAHEIISTYHTVDIAEAVVGSYGKLDKAGLPELNITQLLAEDQTVNLPVLMKDALGFNSLSEARRLINQGGVSINDVKVLPDTFTVSLVAGDIFKFGKTKFVKITKK